MGALDEDGALTPAGRKMVSGSAWLSSLSTHTANRARAFSVSLWFA